MAIDESSFEYCQLVNGMKGHELKAELASIGTGMSDVIKQRNRESYYVLELTFGEDLGFVLHPYAN
jgi:hypothetical protein